MGYLWQREAIAKGEHQFEAIGVGHQLTAYVNNKFPELNVRFYVQTMGQLNKVVWTAEFDSVDEFHGKVARVHDEEGRLRAREEVEQAIEAILEENACVAHSE